MPKLIWEKKLQEAVKPQQYVGWFVHSGQRKRYLKSLNQKKSRCLLGIVIPATSPATNLAKTVVNTSYGLLECLHGMQGVSCSSPLGSIKVLASYTN